MIPNIVDFPNFLLLILFSSFVAWEHALYGFNAFKLIPTWFMAWTVWPILELGTTGWDGLRASGTSAATGALSCLRVVAGLSRWSTRYWKWGTEGSNDHSWKSISPFNCQVLLHVSGALTSGVYATRYGFHVVKLINLSWLLDVTHVSCHHWFQYSIFNCAWQSPKLDILYFPWPENKHVNLQPSVDQGRSDCLAAYSREDNPPTAPNASHVCSQSAHSAPPPLHSLTQRHRAPSHRQLTC